ncbi:type VII secretion protein EccB [Mycobacterium sp. 236(2023)]|uniref:type VII secretion protein EccB n=1 Tax=Mycobacterium sp. 236(2023) TaxID=3038163 RepID=UPI00241517F6|nr:type VII secretion protein EccB [Mycobacterium sp. 236(2023)]MDG4663174.1 type VII secretion protein EccB [Mycobacterium sp. 236(2023)]
MSGPDGERRSFTSRTPANENPERVTYRRGFVTRHQVTGWRFVMRRIASGVALHDTRMLVDPLRTQSRAVLVGAMVLVTGLIGCFLFSLIRPSGDAGTDSVLADRDTAALYVRLGDRLHPVLNLTSARLITGRPDNPAMVKSSELDQFPRGNMLGIPGAPERMVANPTRDAYWTVCDAATGSVTGVTVIAGKPAEGGERAAALPAGHAVLAENEGRTWLLWNGRRSPIDLADRAVTGGVGIGVDIAAPQPIASGLFNAIPESPPLVAPAIIGAGLPSDIGLPEPFPVGAVVVAYDTGGSADTPRYYVVHMEGLQPVSPVVAAILRNTNSWGLAQPPRLDADVVARVPEAGGVDVNAYPAERVTLVDTAIDPVTCAAWAEPEGAQTSSLTLLSGAALPLSEDQRTVSLVSSGAPGGPANQVALPPGTGYVVDSAGSLFWVSDIGVRYGIESGDDDTAEALGLTTAPLPIPPAVLSQFAAGPTLSRTDALLAHDTLAPNPAPARVEQATLLENP